MNGDDVLEDQGAIPAPGEWAGSGSAALSAPTGRRAGRTFGRDRGKFVAPDDFNDPLPEDILRAMEGDDPDDPLFTKPTVPQVRPTSMNIYEAKTHFSQLVARVEAGEDVLICRAGKPIARLCAIEPDPGPRVFFQDEGLFDVPDDFNDLPDELAREFESEIEI